MDGAARKQNVFSRLQRDSIRREKASSQTAPTPRADDAPVTTSDHGWTEVFRSCQNLRRAQRQRSEVEMGVGALVRRCLRIFQVVVRMF